MLRKILSYGLIAGLIAGGVVSAFVVFMGNQAAFDWGMVVGYLSMLVALSAIFVAIKKHRDDNLGGVIRFLPAFGLGLGISFVAGIVYALAWEATVALTGIDFIGPYTTAMIEQEKANGVSGEALAKFVAEMEKLRTDYANPWFRLPMTFTEIFPVGVLVSLICAALLRNARFLAVKRGG